MTMKFWKNLVLIQSLVMELYKFVNFYFIILIFKKLSIKMGQREWAGLIIILIVVFIIIMLIWYIFTWIYSFLYYNYEMPKGIDRIANSFEKISLTLDKMEKNNLLNNSNL